MDERFRLVRRSLSLLRYHRKSQILWRVAKLIRHWTAARFGVRIPRVPGKLELRPNGRFELLATRKIQSRLRNGLDESASRLMQGDFQFLNLSRRLPDPIDWRLDGQQGVEHLWRFRLHEHDYLLDLIAEWDASHNEPFRQRAWDIVRQWIAGNRLSDPHVLQDAWHPYCISRRLPVWITLWTYSPPPPEMEQEVLASVFQQASYLGRNLEWDLGGNHLFDNARALALAGAWFDGPAPDQWLSRAASILRREIPEQILSYGEHFERSPMYHGLVLEMLLDVSQGVQSIAPELSAECLQAAAKMSQFLSEILHPDQDLPLLGDSCLGQVPAPRFLIDATQSIADTGTHGSTATTRGGKPPRQANCCGDYWVFRDRDDFLLFDGGPVAADHLPAHGHCDLLGLEASLDGRRFIVDSGVFNYEADSMREYCRGTRAHNVLQVDDAEMCDVWSKFRMGYRGQASGLANGTQDAFSWVAASHDAFRRVGVPVVERRIACRPGGPWMWLDIAVGQGDHTLSSFVHLHPDVQVQSVAGNCLRCEQAGRVVWLQLLGPGEVLKENGWYCPEFGVRSPAPVIVGRQSGLLPSCLGWILLFEEPTEEAKLEVHSDRRAVVRWCGEQLSLVGNL